MADNKHDIEERAIVGYKDDTIVAAIVVEQSSVNERRAFIRDCKSEGIMVFKNVPVSQVRILTA